MSTSDTIQAVLMFAALFIIAYFLEKKRLKKLGIDVKSAKVDIAASLMGMPSEDLDICGEYGKVLEKIGNEQDFVFPVSSLPYPKERIKKALEACISKATDEELVKPFRVGLFSLKFFVPDNELPDMNDKEGREKLWLEIMKLDISE